MGIHIISTVGTQKSTLPVSLSALNQQCGNLLGAIRDKDWSKALGFGNQALGEAKKDDLGGLSGIIANVVALIEAINQGSLTTWANMASAMAKDNASYSATEQTTLQADITKINGLSPSDQGYQAAVDQYTTDQANFQQDIMTTQTDAGTASDAVSDLTKTFQGDYQHISGILQLYTNLARIMGG